MIFKPLLVMTPPGETLNNFEKYQLYHFDISYQLANLYMELVRIFDPNARDGLLYVFYMMSVSKMTLISDMYGYTMIVTETHYYLQVFSLLYIISIALISLTIGILRFKKREISI